MKSLFPIACVIALTTSGAALARDDCRHPMAEWQSREAVTAQVTGRGITTERLRIDDGCYEVRGRDGDGNQVELTIDPVSLSILELDVDFRPGADPARYLPAVRTQAGKPQAGKASNDPVATPAASR